MSKKTTSQRALWSTRFAFIMASAGAAVGIGNIWKFPYLAGENGGSAFVLLFLISVGLIALPVLIGETLIGRVGRQNSVDTLASLAKKYQGSKAWALLGWISMLTLLLILSFYSVIAGWSLAYLFKALNGQFNNIQVPHIQAIWNQLLANPLAMLLWHTLFMGLTIFIVARGIHKGIEKLSNILMPTLFIVLIFLMVYALVMGDAKQALHFLFAFKLSDVNFNSIILAMGQAFFSMCTGAGCMLIYGSYLSEKTKLASTTLIIAFLNTLVALLAGLAIFPLVFAHGLSPAGGPGLMFLALPMAFTNMVGTTLISALFFSLLFFAAWTSSISMLEPIVVLLIEKTKIKRPMAAFLIGTLAWALGLITLFSFNIWGAITLHNWSLFTIMTDLPTNILLPIGGLLFSLFAGWVVPSTLTQKESDISCPILYKIWLVSVRYIAPVAILIILVAGLF
jgi:NSS family neurotransmitter:Na+ symporter